MALVVAMMLERSYIQRTQYNNYALSDKIKVFSQMSNIFESVTSLF